MPQVQVQMHHTKSTKNFERFDAPEVAGVVPAVKNIYLDNDACDKAPAEVTVTVSWEEG